MEFFVLIIILVVVVAVAKAASENERSSTPSQHLFDSSADGAEHDVGIRLTFSIGGQEPLKGPLSNSGACWQPPGQEVEIGNLAISDGSIYVGASLPSVAEWRGLEPALIDPKLPRNPANPDHSGEGMSYSPAYASMPARCRSAYLIWLASGKSAAGAYIGYVFLYFYGLERRALHDTESLASAREELPALTSEVQRLLKIYGTNASFYGYATRFLEFLQLRSGSWEPGLEPPAELPNGDLPLTLRLGVGQMAANGSPLPGEWALAWVRRDMNISLRTPASRCREEFDELFRILYRDKHGEGLTLKPCKRNVSAHYRPASPSFLGSLEIDTQYPDVTRLVGPRRKLHDLATRSDDALDGYSRWLGRNPDGRGTLPAAALLPPELLATHAPEEFSNLRRSLQEKIGDQSIALLASEVVLGQWFDSGTDKLTKKQAVQAAHLLGHAGFGFEPDVRFCGKKPEKHGQVAVFRLQEIDSGNPSAEYSATVVLMHLAAMVSAADGEVGLDEKRHLRDHLAAGLDLQPAEIQRLGAYLEWLLANPPERLGGKKRLERLDSAQRRAIGELLVSVACADGRIEPEEVKVLTQMFRLLDLDPGSVHEWLHTHQASGNAGPVTVVPDTRGEHSGYSLPKSQGAATEPKRMVRLDPAIIAAKLKESEQAAATLAGIFIDEDEESLSTATPVTAESGATLIEGLDGPHSALLRKLARRPSWSRADYESLADQIGVMPDGALDLLNDAAFELCEDPAIEGHDPLEISSAVVQEMLA